MQKDERCVVTAIGNTNAGKSTLLSALVETPITPSGPLTLTPKPMELVVSERKAGRFFSVVDRYGNQEDLPISGLLQKLEQLEADAERIILYANPSRLLERVRLMDLPGVKMSYDDVVRGFLEGSGSCDVLLHVVSAVDDTVNSVFEVLDDDSVLPRERVIVVNKLDRLIQWDDDPCLKSVVKATVNNVREGLLRTMGKTDLVPRSVVACSSLLALAAEVWDDEVLEGVLRLAEPGDMAILSSKHFFKTETDALPSVRDRTVLLDLANEKLLGQWVAPDYHKPAFPALQFATRLSVKQGITSTETDELRSALRNFSGIDRLRSDVLEVSASPRIETRRRMSGKVRHKASEILALRQSVARTRLLLEDAKRIASKITNEVGHTDERRFYSNLGTYLTDRASELSGDLTTASQWVSDIRESYLAETEQAVSVDVSAD